MAEISWEKPRSAIATGRFRSARTKFAAVGFVLMGIMAFMLLSATIAGGRFFITVNEVLSRPELAGKIVKITGAVIGPTIRFDADTKTIYFTIANITDNMDEIQKMGGLAKALHLAVTDTNNQHVDVVVRNQAMPDLLQNEAQAILTGKLGADGVFYADDVQLKCPSRYESDLPQQAKG
jgi:cytochrome c-type biogenesis protein CcmE